METPALTPRILSQLRRPIPAAEVKFRSGGSGVLAYIDARTVQERLDAVDPTWSASFTVISLDGTQAVVECHLTIAGVTRTDVGTGSGPEAVKSAYSDSLKRAAVAFSVGRCLYDYRPPRKSFKGGIDGRALEELRGHYSEWLAKKGEDKYGPVWAPDEVIATFGTWHAIAVNVPADNDGAPSLPELRVLARDLVKGGSITWEDLTLYLGANGYELTNAESWDADERSDVAILLNGLLADAEREW